MHNKTIDEGKSFFIQTFQLVNRNKFLQLEYHQFATPNELIDVAVYHQWLLKPIKENQPDTVIMFLLKGEHNPLTRQSCKKMCVYIDINMDRQVKCR